MAAMTDFVLLASKITNDGDYSHEIKRCLLRVRKAIKNLTFADDTTFMAESKEELKSLLMKVKEENEKVGLKLNI